VERLRVFAAAFVLVMEDWMRTKLVLSIVMVAALGLFTSLSFAPRASAQDTTTTSKIVGTWIADTDTTDPTNGPSIFTFTSDGTYSEIDDDGTVALGVWEENDDDTVTLTAWNFAGDGQGGSFGGFTIRATITLGADGDTFTAKYTLEFTDPVGNSSGQAGPGEASGRRAHAEAPGTPTMTLQQLFELITANTPGGGETSSPEATSEATGEATGSSTSEATEMPSSEATESSTAESTESATAETTPEATSTP